MRITRLSLTNFRSFKDTQTIDFAPVTLLFGPNSVGKSTVLMALFYLQQILDKGQCNPMRLEALGNKYIGGFKNLVNGRDLTKSITIRVDYDKQGAIGSTYGKTTSAIAESRGLMELPIMMQDQALLTEKVGLEFVISWSKPKNTAFVEKVRFWLNELYLGETSCDEGLKNPLISHIDFSNPLLLPSMHDEWLFEKYEVGSEHLSSRWADSMGFGERGFGQDFTDHFSDDGLVSQLDEILGREITYGLEGIAGAVPKPGQVLETSMSLDDAFTTMILHEAFSEVFVSPIDNLLKILNGSICIGPLRCIPDANYQPNQYPAQADWYDGTAAWDEISSPDLLRDTSINKWLKDEDKLNIGYRIVYMVEETEARFVQPTLSIEKPDDALALHDALGEQLKLSVSKEQLKKNKSVKEIALSNEDLEEIRKDKGPNSLLYISQNSNKVTKVTLWDAHNNIPVTSSEVGVGISQLFPLVVASQANKKGIIACEQPELHVHPRIQVAIGDLLTQTCNNKQYLIETHSEHLVLRVLRRIRETSSGTLADGFTAVNADNLSVIYLDSSDNGVIAQKFEIEPDGDFSNDWPHGFFEERDEELF